MSLQDSDYTNPSIIPLNPHDLRTYPVQKKPCQTCPFAGEKPLPLEPDRYAFYVDNLVNFKGQHFCHSLDNKAICRGGRDIQLRMLCAIGRLDEPTDDAFDEAMSVVLSHAHDVPVP